MWVHTSCQVLLFLWDIVGLFWRISFKERKLFWHQRFEACCVINISLKAFLPLVKKSSQRKYFCLMHKRILLVQQEFGCACVETFCEVTVASDWAPLSRSLVQIVWKNEEGGAQWWVGGQICTQRIPAVHTFDILARGGGHGGHTAHPSVPHLLHPHHRFHFQLYYPFSNTLPAWMGYC